MGECAKRPHRLPTLIEFNDCLFHLIINKINIKSFILIFIHNIPFLSSKKI